MIFNDDGTGQLIALKPPVRETDLHVMVDKVAGTGVTTLCIALHDGHTVWHESKVATHIADISGPFASPSQFRRVAVCRSMREQGIDPMRIFVNRAVELGLKLFPSLRMNDAHGGARQSAFWRTNQDLLLDGLKYDYAKAGTREFRLTQIEEVCRAYDVDGFELDFMRVPHFFQGPKAESHFMTEFVRDVRRMMDEIGGSREKHLDLMVILPRTIMECVEIGLDVRAWIDEGLINVVVAKNFIYFEQNLPVREWATLVKNTPVTFYAGFEQSDTLESFRAGAANYFRGGTDGIYLYNFRLPCNSVGRQIFSEIDDPEKLDGQDKHYALLGGGPCGVEGGDPHPPTTQVPVDVLAGGAADFTIELADDITCAYKVGALKDVTLRVVVDDAVEDIDLVINGHKICRSLVSFGDSLCDVVLVEPLMNQGLNTLTVINRGGEAVRILSVETLVHYFRSRPVVRLPDGIDGVSEDRDMRYAQEEAPWTGVASECLSIPIELQEREWIEVMVNIPSIDLGEIVRFEFRTPRGNAAPYETKWPHLYNAQPWETDVYEFKVNGHIVQAWELICREHPNMRERDYWHWGVRFDAPAEWLNTGENCVAVRLASRDPDVGWGVTFVYVDLFQC